MKKDVIQALNFGQRIAEEEIDQLAAYFVETDQWKKIYTGDIDIVYGVKGAGKSAIYFPRSLLLSFLFPLKLSFIGREKLTYADVQLQAVQ